MKLSRILLIGLLAATALAQAPAQSITVMGASNLPGVYAIPTNGLTVTQALTMSGGLRQDAVREIEILRQNPKANPQGVEIIKVNIDEVNAGKAMDIQLQPWDVIRIHVSR